MIREKYLSNTMEYLLKRGLSGNFIDNVVKKQPVIDSDIEQIADFNVSTSSDLVTMLKTAINHNVDLLGYARVPGDDKVPFNGIFDTVYNSSNIITYLSNSFVTLENSDSKLDVIPVYKKDLALKGIDGTLCVLAVMPIDDFESKAERIHDFDNYISLIRDTGAIAIGSHVYTIKDPKGGFIKYRPATNDERKIISDEVFPKVDNIEKVSTNVLWMSNLDFEAEDEYRNFRANPEFIILADSDTVAPNNYGLKEIGRSGNILPLIDAANMLEYNDHLKVILRHGEFDNYHNATPLFRFGNNVAFNK